MPINMTKRLFLGTSKTNYKMKRLPDCERLADPEDASFGRDVDEDVPAGAAQARFRHHGPLGNASS